MSLQKIVDNVVAHGGEARIVDDLFVAARFGSIKLVLDEEKFKIIDEGMLNIVCSNTYMSSIAAAEKQLQAAKTARLQLENCLESLISVNSDTFTQIKDVWFIDHHVWQTLRCENFGSEFKFNKKNVVSEFHSCKHDAERYVKNTPGITLIEVKLRGNIEDYFLLKIFSNWE